MRTFVNCSERTGSNNFSKKSSNSREDPKSQKGPQFSLTAGPQSVSRPAPTRVDSATTAPSSHGGAGRSGRFPTGRAPGGPIGSDRDGPAGDGGPKPGLLDGEGGLGLGLGLAVAGAAVVEEEDVGGGDEVEEDEEGGEEGQGGGHEEEAAPGGAGEAALRVAEEEGGRSHLPSPRDSGREGRTVMRITALPLLSLLLLLPHAEPIQGARQKLGLVFLRGPELELSRANE